LVVTAAAGGVTDVVARAFGQKFAESWGEQVIVENKGGAAHVTGATSVARATPDGHTLMVAEAGTFTINPQIYAKGKLTYDEKTDFIPITGLVRINQALLVNKALPVSNVRELIALAKAQPGKLNFASAGVGGLPHLAGELFKLTAKIDIVHVPYRGAAPAINDLLGQQVQMTFLDLPVILPHIKAGSLKPIALGSPTRAPTAPDVPTTAEVGMPDLLIENWYGMIAPGGTPEKIIAELNRITNEAMADPGVKAKLADQGLTVAGDSPAHFRGFIDSETRKWAKVIKDSGIEIAK
ncbi:MAG: tripartite tricarboxylate transporter substrate binding protein, partial [Chthoniobacterales bacterium]|nr:tripartite tricarboxylate transporter substrate binding protein [Chthoniobacterales bacterium]